MPAKSRDKMISLKLGDKNYKCQAEETVLDSLLRQGVTIPYNCKKGMCLSCMLRCTDTVPDKMQGDLKDTLKKQNYFLACLCTPEQDMSLTLPNQSDLFSTATVVAKEMLNRNTLLLTIESQKQIEYSAGQFVDLKIEGGVTRSYSIANVPDQKNRLEFHIRRIEKGQFSCWAHDELNVGNELLISDVKGHCFYISERKEQSLLLIGTGTGLAPLEGIVMDALLSGHTGSIHLFHGSREKEDLYHIDEMRALSEAYANFYYTPCISGSQPIEEGFKQGRADNLALSEISDLAGWRVFLCGNPEMVEQTKTFAFIQGASIADIYTDAFYIND
jgi:NAD(P)H-flavin reductase